MSAVLNGGEICYTAINNYYIRLHIELQGLEEKKPLKVESCLSNN